MTHALPAPGSPAGARVGGALGTVGASRSPCAISPTPAATMAPIASCAIPVYATRADEPAAWKLSAFLPTSEANTASAPASGASSERMTRTSG